MDSAPSSLSSTSCGKRSGERAVNNRDSRGPTGGGGLGRTSRRNRMRFLHSTLTPRTERRPAARRGPRATRTGGPTLAGAARMGVTDLRSSTGRPFPSSATPKFKKPGDDQNPPQTVVPMEPRGEAIGGTPPQRSERRFGVLGPQRIDRDGVGFASHENLAEVVPYLNRSLNDLGYPGPLELEAPSVGDRARVANVLFLILRDRQQDAASREQWGRGAAAARGGQGPRGDLLRARARSSPRRMRSWRIRRPSPTGGWTRNGRGSTTRPRSAPA